MTFSSIAGILELDTNSGTQTLAPVVDADYATP
jgi:hypothetical protein